MKTMKKTKILAKNQQKIENCAENLQKTDGIPIFSAGVAQMIFWDLIPQVSEAYSRYYDFLSLMYSRSNVIIGEKNNVKGKKEIGK